jgi:hypothetical protein
MFGPDILVALDLGPKLVRNQFRVDADEARPAPPRISLAAMLGRRRR